MFSLFIRCILNLVKLAKTSPDDDSTSNILNITLDVYFIIIVLLYSPIVFLQLQSQCGKLCKQNLSGSQQVVDENESHYHDGETNYEGTLYGRSRAGSREELR